MRQPPTGQPDRPADGPGREGSSDDITDDSGLAGAFTREAACVVALDCHASYCHSPSSAAAVTATGPTCSASMRGASSMRERASTTKSLRSRDGQAATAESSGRRAQPQQFRPVGDGQTVNSSGAEPSESARLQDEHQRGDRATRSRQRTAGLVDELQSSHRFVIGVLASMLVLSLGTFGYLILVSQPQVTNYVELARESRDVNDSMLDQETGLRGWLITGDEKDLRPYVEGKGTRHRRGLPAAERRTEEFRRHRPGARHPAGRSTLADVGQPGRRQDRHRRPAADRPTHGVRCSWAGGCSTPTAPSTT